MNIVQQILKGFQRVMEISLHSLEKGMNFQEFEEKLWEVMNGMGKDILKAVLEARDQEIRKEKRSCQKVCKCQTRVSASSCLVSVSSLLSSELNLK